MTKSEKAMQLTENIGARLTDLGDAIESIHYDPERADAKDIDALKEIKRLVEQAAKLAEKTKARLG